MSVWMAAVVAALAGRAEAHVFVSSSEQAEQRDANGNIMVEAATIHVVRCSDPGENGGEYLVYAYRNREGFRAIQPPNWGSPVGGRDFDTAEQAAAAACGMGQPQQPTTPGTPGCGIGEQWTVSDTDGEWAGVWTRRGTGTTFDATWTRAGEPDLSAVLDIQLSGSEVTIHRTDPPNKFLVTDCLYEGTLSADGTTASGKVTCNSQRGPLGPHDWSASISCSRTIQVIGSGGVSHGE